MDPVLTTLAAGLGVIVAALTLLWLLSLRLRDASIVDIFWGLGFVALVWFYSSRAAPSGRSDLLVALTTIWGLRLWLHLLKRNWGKGEDYRYAEMRQGHGKRFWWVSLFTVYWLQALILWIVSFPLWHGHRGVDPLGPLDWIGAGLSVVGILFESVGDLQLVRFKRDPANSGRVLDTGLWRYTRHPNYFGDALFWWGIALIAMGVPGWGWMLLGPLLMTVLLMRVSGVTLLERRLAETKPEYRDYAERTNAFFPWFPRQR